jgi:site-specific recombinase XerD
MLWILRSIFLFMDIKASAKRFCDEARQFHGYTDATIRRYRSVIEMFGTQTNIGQLEKISAENVREWFFQGRTERKWSAQTFRTYYKSLNMFFRWCRKAKSIHIDPLLDLALPKLEKSLPRGLRREQAMRLLEITQNYPWSDGFLRERNHAIIATFLYAGLRKGELMHLTLSDVDLTGLSIFVHRGKGKKDRIVPMSQSLADILIEYQRERQRRQKTVPEFFTKMDTNQGLTEDALRCLVQTLRETAGFSFGVHQLRHTFATLMLEGGCDIYSLSRMMGHSDISTTTIYLSASAEHLRSQITKHPLDTDRLIHKTELWEQEPFKKVSKWDRPVVPVLPRTSGS